MKSWKQYGLIVIISLLPLISIFLTSDLPHTSDGIPHTIRTAMYYKELVAGQFPVRWASQLDYRYGTPVFVFFTPLPYMIGSLFVALGFSLIVTLKLGFTLSYLLAGIFMYLFAKSYFKDEKAAFFVTIMYQFAPFRLVDMLVRGSLGSLYSYSFLPLLFYAITKYLEKKTYRFFALIALSTALLSLTHNIIGFVFFGITSLYVPFTTRKIKDILFTYFAMFTGLAIAGFFLIPALLEHKYTNGYLFTKDLFWNHFPAFYKLLLPNITNAVSLRVAEVPVQIGIIHLLALVIVVILLLKKRLLGYRRIFAIYLITISFLTILFIEPVTKILWEHVSIIRQFQYPWRLLSVITFTSSIASAVVLIQYEVLRKRLVYAALTCIVIVSTVAYWVPYQGFQKVHEKDFWDYPLSTNYFGEVNTIWMEHEPSVFPEKRVEVIAGTGLIQNEKFENTKHTFTIFAENSVGILDRTYFFPGWSVRVDGDEVPIQFQDQNHRGLITFTLTKGVHTVEVIKKEDKLELVSDMISILSLVFLLGVGLFMGLRKKSI